MKPVLHESGYTVCKTNHSDGYYIFAAGVSEYRMGAALTKADSLEQAQLLMNDLKRRKNNLPADLRKVVPEMRAASEALHKSKRKCPQGGCPSKLHRQTDEN